jgi:hypothetical protein
MVIRVQADWKAGLAAASRLGLPNVGSPGELRQLSWRIPICGKLPMRHSSHSKPQSAQTAEYAKADVGERYGDFATSH